MKVRNFIVILLLITLCCHSLMKLGIYTWYELNKDYVAEVLCVNKDKPDLNCEGKCQLKKQLNKVSASTEGTNTELPNTPKEVEIIAIVLPDAPFLQQYSWFTAVENRNYYTYSEHLQNRFPDSIFRPPCC